MIDFSSYIDDKPKKAEGNKEPHLPAAAKDSILWVAISMDPAPKYPAIRYPSLSVTRNGFVQIPLIVTVVGGKFDGMRFYHNLFAPEEYQHMSLTDGQKKACNIACIQIRKLLLSGTGFGARDTSEEAKKAAMLNSWQDLNGKKALVKIGEFNGHPQIDAVLCSDSADYAKGEQLSASAQAWVPNTPVSQAIQDKFGPFEPDDDCPF